MTKIDGIDIDELANEIRRVDADIKQAAERIAGDYLRFNISCAALYRDVSAALQSERIASQARERERCANEIAALRRQAEQWKGEALAHKSSLHEAYQVLTSATGEPANWNGARPFKQFKKADQEAFVEWLRAWVRMKFGKIITFQTAYGARTSFNAERSHLVRDALAATAIRNGGEG